MRVDRPPCPPRVEAEPRVPIFAGRMGATSSQIFEALRTGKPVSDEEFDRVFPPWARKPSRLHWTPLETARRAAELLAWREGARILDVGSGVGKFCLVGALTTDGVFVGVEQREQFVKVARAVARRGRVPRCLFLHGNLLELDWRGFDGLYLYNPFAENLPGHEPIDETVKRSVRKYRRYVRFIEELLAEAPAELRVVTYHGFGGEMPVGWSEAAYEWSGSGPLVLWRKTSAPRGHGVEELHRQ